MAHPPPPNNLIESSLTIYYILYNGVHNVYILYNGVHNVYVHRIIPYYDDGATPLLKSH